MLQKTLSQWALGCFGSLLCLALLLPNHYQPWLSFHQEWLTVIAFSPLMAWALWRQCREAQPRLPWLVVAALFGVLWAALQWFAGRLSFYSDALLAAAYWLLLAASVLAGRQVAKRNNAWFDGAGALPFWLAWVFAGILSLAVALHQWLDLSYFGLFVIDLPPGSRPFANLAQPNHLATLFLLSLTGALYLYEARKTSAPTACALIVCICFGLAMTQSRSVLLGLLLLGIVFYATRQRYRLRTPAWGFAALIFVYLSLSLAWPWINQALLLGNDVQSVFDRTTPGIRLIFWRSALDAIVLKPWMGWGFGQINWAQQATALAYPATHTFFSSAHNIALDLILWMGIPGAALIFVLLGLHVHDGWKSAAPDHAAWAAWAGLASLCGHALVEFPLFYAYFLVPAGFLLGWLSSGGACGVSLANWKLPQRIGVALLALLALVFFPKLTAEYFSWEDDFRNLRFEVLKYSNVQPAFQPDVVLLDQIAAMHRVDRQQPSSDMAVDALALFQKNADRHPSSYALLRNAYASALNGRPEAAQRSLQLLCSLHSKALCAEARRQWNDKASNEQPLLRLVAFPPAPALDAQ